MERTAESDWPQVPEYIQLAALERISQIGSSITTMI